MAEKLTATHKTASARILLHFPLSMSFSRGLASVPACFDVILLAPPHQTVHKPSPALEASVQAHPNPNLTANPAPGATAANANGIPLSLSLPRAHSNLPTLLLRMARSSHVYLRAEPALISAPDPVQCHCASSHPPNLQRPPVGP